MRKDLSVFQHNGMTHEGFQVGHRSAQRTRRVEQPLLGQAPGRPHLQLRRRFVQHIYGGRLATDRLGAAFKDRFQALRQVLTPMGTFNCPAHRGVEKARVGGLDAYTDETMANLTGGQLTDLMDRFDASRECREVTCLYNGVNWWLEKMIEDPRDEIEIEPGDERFDFFL